MCPHIPLEDRTSLLSEADPEDVGELTYMFTFYACQYLMRHGKNPHYADLAEVLSAFDGAKAEFLRVIVGPYEERKRAINGDAYKALRERMGLTNEALSLRSDDRLP